MAVVRKKGLCRLTMIGVSLAALSACQSWSSMIGLEVHQVDGEYVFDDPDALFFTYDCIVSIEVNEVRKVANLGTEIRTENQVWVDSSLDGDCLTDLPFRYGERFQNSDPYDYVSARPLEPGREYEIFVERSGRAGQGSFRINPDGSVTNLD